MDTSVLDGVLVGLFVLDGRLANITVFRLVHINRSTGNDGICLERHGEFIMMWIRFALGLVGLFGILLMYPYFKPAFEMLTALYNAEFTSPSVINTILMDNFHLWPLAMGVVLCLALMISAVMGLGKKRDGG